MKIPTWVRLVGAAEVVSSAWAFYGLAGVVSVQGIRSVAIGCALLAVALVACAGAFGGYRLARGDARGARLSLVALAAQSVRLSLPGLVWLVGLGWTINFVLYEGQGVTPDGQDIAAWIGHHEYAAYFAINVPALLLFALMLGWWNRRSSAVAAESLRAPAV